MYVGWRASAVLFAVWSWVQAGILECASSLVLVNQHLVGAGVIVGGRVRYSLQSGVLVRARMLRFISSLVVPINTNEFHENLPLLSNLLINSNFIFFQENLFVGLGDAGGRALWWRRYGERFVTPSARF
jgi:hypothetical protein